jgi:hypothetical protein
MGFFSFIARKKVLPSLALHNPFFFFSLRKKRGKREAWQLAELSKFRHTKGFLSFLTRDEGI